MRQEIKDRLADDILSILESYKSEQDLLSWKYGSSPSSVKCRLEEDFGWRGFGSLSSFGIMVEDLGFSIVSARKANGEHHKSSRVIIL